MARLMPISLVRSATLIAIVLMTDRPPTTRLMMATPMMIALKMAVEAPTCSSNSAPVIVALFATAPSISRRNVVDVRAGIGIHDDLVDELLGLDRISDQRGKRLDEQLLRGARAARGRWCPAPSAWAGACRSPRTRRPRISIVSPAATSYSLPCLEPSTTRLPSSSGVSIRPVASCSWNCSCPSSAPGMAPMTMLRNAERNAWLQVQEQLDLRVNGGHAVEVANGVRRLEAHRCGAERGAVGHEDLVGVVLATALDEGIDLVCHRAEDDECPDPDRDAQDREGRPQLPARELAQQAHRFPQ